MQTIGVGQGEEEWEWKKVEDEVKRGTLRFSIYPKQAGVESDARMPNVRGLHRTALPTPPSEPA